RRPTIRHNRHCYRPTRPRIFQRTQHVRRGPASRNPHHHILARQLPPAQIPHRFVSRILCTLYRASHRSPPARNRRHHPRTRNPKRRRHFRCVQHRHPPTRPSPHIKQPPTIAQRRHNRIHRPRNRVQLASHRDRHFAVLTIHQPHKLDRRHPI